MQRTASVIADVEPGSMEMVSIPENGPDGSPLAKPFDNDDSIRALIYTTCYNVLDGVTITIRKLEREILAAGGSVCILTTKSGNINNTNLVPKHDNRCVIFMDNSLPIPFQSDPNDPSVSYHLGISLSKNIQEQLDIFQPNIIHITAPDFTSLHVHNYARQRQIPLMGTYHSNIPEYMLFVPGMRWVKPVLELLFRHIYNFLIRLYVPTPFIRNMLIDQQAMDKVTEVGVWGRGVDLDRFKTANRSQEFRKKLIIAPDCPIVLYVGRLVPEKRPDIVATIVKRLTAQGVDFRCVIVGAGPAEYLIDSLPNTHHLGWLSGEELAEAYASSDIFLFPSSVETFGNVTLEAAASGLPLVVEKNCSGHLVDHQVNGFACPTGDVSAFYDGTLELCKDAEKRARFSMKSVEKSKKLDQSAVVREMLDNYKSVRIEFYEQYGGNHFNRDEAYRHEGSFQMGMDPRPFGWFIVEFILLNAIKFANFVIAIATWVESRRATSAYRGVQTNDDDDDDSNFDVEAQSGNTTPTLVVEEEETKPGCLCNILISIGDSPITANIVMFIIGIFLFFSRRISAIRRSYAKRFRSKAFETIDIDAAFGRSRQKRMD
mmetsp:Transcript_12703/g.23814  ORF Transcript_12703/g.23814 Transcript_12703/m.23814 type:complete len:601 (-) Transcript_12703:66-1868(-)